MSKLLTGLSHPGLITGTILFLLMSSPLGAAESSDTPEKTPQSEQGASPKKAKIEETVLGMNISGTKEAPNVLYIIPWKSNATGAKLPEVSRLVGEVYAPVDPEVFAKQVKFYQQLTTKPIDNSLEESD